MIDNQKTMFLFQRLSVDLQMGNAVSFLATFATQKCDRRNSRTFCLQALC